MEKLLKIDPHDPEIHLIERAADILLQGGVIGYPTETVYGLGCSAFDTDAVDRVFALKNRDRRKALILIAGDIIQISDLVESIPESAEVLIENFWPGPLTIVFEASSRLNEFAFRNSKTVAVRIPDSAICLDLMKQTGFPLVSTSANMNGQPAATSAQTVVETFGDQLDLIIDAGPTPEITHSTLIDVTKDPPRILRQGAISDLEIKTVLDTLL